jgi:hypothetical protein
LDFGISYWALAFGMGFVIGFWASEWDFGLCQLGLWISLDFGISFRASDFRIDLELDRGPCEFLTGALDFFGFWNLVLELDLELDLGLIYGLWN